MSNEDLIFYIETAIKNLENENNFYARGAIDAYNDVLSKLKG